MAKLLQRRLANRAPRRPSSGEGSMQTQANRMVRRSAIKERIRRKLHGTAERPRLAVFRSLKHFYMHAVDDTSSKTLCSASTLDKDLRARVKPGGNLAAARAVGALIATRLKERGIASVVFDRGGFLYHGRVKAAADSARENGLKF